MAMVYHIASYEEDDEVIYALLWRDAVHDDLRSGSFPEVALLAKSRAADNLLLRQRVEIVARFPEVFRPDRKANRSRDHWWWYLDEGPQVREEAERAA